jgi:hypothetical protein
VLLQTGHPKRPELAVLVHRNFRAVFPGLINVWHICRIRFAMGRTEEARMAEEDRWYVLRVRAGFEELVTSGLRSRGIEVFLPSNNFRISRQSGKIHIFARFSLANQRDVSLTPGVMDLVGVPNPIAVSERDVDTLKIATHAGMTMKILPMGGEPVRGQISKGPLAGHEGNFIEHRGTWNLAVRLESLECNLAFALPASSLDIFRKKRIRGH